MIAGEIQGQRQSVIQELQYYEMAWYEDMKPKYKKFQIESDVSEQNHYKSNILRLMLTKKLWKM